jgi:hypothetical protein
VDVLPASPANRTGVHHTGLRRIYYGVPKFCGALFRATRAPSLILLAGLVGVPLVSSIYTTAYVYRHHSTLPIDLFCVGFVQFQIAIDPNIAHQQLPPSVAELMRMTPERKAAGKRVFEAYIALSAVLTVAAFWWSYRLLQFVTRLLNRRTF